MLIVPGLFGLIIYVLTRPFDFVPVLRSIPFLYAFFGLAVAGFMLDLAKRHTPWIRGPQLPWAIGLLAWAAFTALWRAPRVLGTSWLQLLIAVSLYFLLAHGLVGFRRFSAIASVILACTIWVSAVCVHEGLQPFQCVGFDPAESPEQNGVGDGRGCEGPAECNQDAPEPDWDYRCERVGMAGISSIGHGRVRYVGVLHDPNEASLAVSLGIPLAIARYQRRRSWSRLLTMCVAIALAAITVVWSRSRGGQLVFLTVLGVYFVRKYRWKGVIVAGLLALPVILFGGRAGAEAQESSSDRLGCAYAGIQMFLRSRLLGVGFDQFLEHHVQTAHNSYVLAPAELGLPGMVLWGMVLWTSIKICFPALRSSGPESEEERTWGIAVFSALLGLSAGVLFLSFNYHYVLWSFFGLAGAYHGALVRRFPDCHVRTGIKDIALVVAANLALMVAVLLYIRWRGVT
jgi:hypothetical protein